MKNKSCKGMLDDEAAELAAAPSAPGVPPMPLKQVVPPLPLKLVGPAMGMQGKPMSLTTTNNAFHPDPFGRKPK